MGTTRFTIVAAAGLAVASATLTVAGAQEVDVRCPAGTLQQVVVQDACQKAVDLFDFMAPQLGIALVGGNATLGQGGALGGTGRFTLGLRAIGLRGRLPRVDEHPPAITGAQADEYEVDDQLFALPTLEAGLGLWRGFALGVVDVLALDALGSLAYIPELEEDDIEIAAPDGSVKVGYGARLGIVQESFVTPSIAVSWMRRELPTVDITGAAGDDSLFVGDTEVRTDAYRLTIGKTFALLGLTAGVGRDELRTATDVRVRVQEGGIAVLTDPIRIEQDLTRTTYFLDASLNLPLVRIAAEIGQTRGGDIATFNTFAGKKADDPLTFVSLGIRIGF